MLDPTEVNSLVEELEAALNALPDQNTASQREVRKQFTQRLKSYPAEDVLTLAKQIIRTTAHRWIAYELIQAHPGAFRTLGKTELVELGEGINSWWTVDSFARTLAGPAWMCGQVDDEVIRGWAASEDLWWRRAALVSTVAWNMRSQGGKGDTRRTLEICRLLAADHEDMVVKALSWALRELVQFDEAAVRDFLEEYAPVLAGRVKHEVRNKLTIGLKNPRLRKKIGLHPQNEENLG